MDVELERQALQSLPDADVTFLVCPSRQLFDQYLWDKGGGDILFFAGHSQTEGQTENQTENQTGRLYINEASVHNSLTIEQLEAGLRGAIARGLQLAIFNSCDGVGLAQAIAQLQIPQVIVMREPVPNQVAQTFLQHFLAAFATEKLALYPAVRQARGQLQGLENEGRWLLVIDQFEELYTLCSREDQQSFLNLILNAVLAFASDDGTVKLWQRDGKLMTTLTGHTAGVNSVAFSPDGQLIASTSDDSTVRLWQRDGRLLSTFTGYQSGVNGIAYSPTGEKLAAATVDETVSLRTSKPALHLDTLGELGCQ